MKHKKQIILWITSIMIISVIYYFNRDYFNYDFWNDISENYTFLVITYFIISILRGFFLLPVTPFLLVGVIFLQPFEYFIISVIGIVFGAMLIYYFSDYFGFHKYFAHSKFEKPIKKSKKYLSGKYGYFIFASWTIIPIVPNVVISYVGGILKVPVKIYFFGTLTGAILESLFYIIFKEVLT